MAGMAGRRTHNVRGSQPVDARVDRQGASPRRPADSPGAPRSGTNSVFEITESAMMTDPARAIETITELGALGIGFAVDDFGTGWSP
jgi:hypothetical protein